MNTEAVVGNDLAAQGWRPRALPGYIGLIGPLWTRREDEHWTYGLLAGEQHLNPAGVMHGGALTSLLDHVVSTLAWEAAGRVPCLTVQLETRFLAPVQAGHLVEARAEIVKVTSSLVFARGQAVVSGHMVADASAILKMLRAGRPDRHQG